MSTESNIYDRLIVVLMTAMAAGQIGGSFQLPRVLLLMLLPVFVYQLLTRKQADIQILRKKSIVYRYETAFFVFWWLWALVSMLFAINLSNSGKTMLYMTVYFLGFFEILWLASKAKNPQRAVLIGWMLMFACTVPIALYELKTDVHLPMSVQQSESSLYGGEVDRLFASVTFGNLNAYNVVLCMTLSMMLIGTLQKGKRIVWVAYICALMSLLLIILNGSRAASICAALILTLYTFMMMRGKKIFLFAATAIAGGLLLYFYKDALSLIIQRFQEQGLEDNGRMKVLICGLKEWYGSGGMGVGIDNFNPIMEYKYHLAITPPHNLWLEVGAQYGIFVFLGFFALFIRLFLASRKGTTFNKTAAFIGIAALLPMSIIDSGYLLKTTTWFYIVSLYMVCNPAYNTPTTQEK